MNLRILLFAIAVCSFSCQDDDMNAIANNRQLEIHFNNPDSYLKKFCLISDDNGVVYWDSIFSDNRSIVKVQVPDDRPLHCTYGVLYNSYSALETYENIGDVFHVKTFGPYSCSNGMPYIASKDTVNLRIHNVEEADIIQSGLYSTSVTDYNAIEKILNIRARIPFDVNSTTDFSSFLVLREIQSEDIFGVLLSNSLFDQSSVANLDITEFHKPKAHIISLSENDFWRSELIGYTEDLIILLDNQYGLDGFPPYSDQITTFLPDDIDMTSFVLKTSKPVINNCRAGQSALYSTLPTDLTVEKPVVSIENIDVPEFEYSLNDGYDVIESSLTYLGVASWSIIHSDQTSIDFKLPVIPMSISDSIEELSTTIDEPDFLTVTAYKMGLGQSIPMHWDVETWNARRRCYEQSYGSEVFTIE